MMNIGTPESVRAWVDKSRRRFVAASHNKELLEHLRSIGVPTTPEDYLEFASKLIMISSYNWDVEDLNKMISTSGYVGIWYERGEKSY